MVKPESRVKHLFDYCALKKGMQQLYKILDLSFVVFHGSLTLFNLTGWIWEKTRPLHLITIGLTILSWFGLGIFFGWGYCPCTEWHWQVKYRLGETDLPYSYVKYYMDKLTGVSWDPIVVDASVVFFGLLAFGLTCWLNWKDHKCHQ
jgi:hypothetical protein